MECFSLTLLESLAANVPVITTPVGGNLEVVEDGGNGFIVPVCNAAAFAAMIVKLWNGYESIQENTRSKIVTEFSIDTMVSKHIKLFGI